MKQTAPRYELKSAKTEFHMKYYPWEQETETKGGLHVTDASHASYCIAGMCMSVQRRVQEMGPTQEKIPLSLTYRRM